MGILALLLLVFLISFLGVYLYYKFALKKAILDLPNERSSHNIPTPRGGGIVIAIMWFLTISILFIINKIDNRIYFALLCGVPISATGLVDDLVTISPKSRLIVQIISASLAVIALGGLKTIDLGCCNFNSIIFISSLAIIGIVWFTNLFNFLDGIDGYISAEILFICTAVFLLFNLSLPLFLAAATLGFLVWNWQPAKIFMGDVGSTLLGFTIAVFAIYYQNNGDSSIIIWLMITSLFWFDATFTLFRRWSNGETLSKAHKKHAYQRIVQSGFSHQKTVIFSTIINLFILGLAWLAILIPTYSLLFLIINIVFLYITTKLVDNRFPFATQ